MSGLLATRAWMADDPRLDAESGVDDRQCVAALAELDAAEAVIKAAREVNEIMGTGMDWEEASAYFHDLDEALRPFEARR